MSHLANEFDVRSESHGQASLAAVNQILCESLGYERLQNSKDSLNACFENVNRENSKVNVKPELCKRTQIIHDSMNLQKSNPFLKCLFLKSCSSLC